MEIQARIRAKAASPDAPPSFAFHGEDPSHPGLFSRIVRGEEQQWRVWEDDGHVAFLTPFPNCPGLTVVVPRRPLTSNIFKLDREDYEGLALASREVSELLEKGLGAWGTGLIFEGFEIDYAHAKLMPLLPPSPLPNKGETGRPPEFHPIYPGYVTSEDGPEADLEDLKKLQTKITGSCFTVETGFAPCLLLGGGEEVEGGGRRVGRKRGRVGERRRRGETAHLLSQVKLCQLAPPPEAQL